MDSPGNNPYQPPQSVSDEPLAGLSSRLDAHLPWDDSGDSVEGKGKHTFAVGVEHMRLLMGKGGWVVMVMSLVCLIAFILLRIWSARLPYFFLVGAVFFPTLFLYAHWLVRRRIRQMIAKGHGNYIPHRIILGAEGVSFETAGSRHSFQWSCIQSYKARGGLINLFLEEGGNRMVHRDFFASEAEFERALAFVRANVPNAGK